MAEYLPNVAHRTAKKHHAQARRHEEHELHFTGTDVALAGIEPAPLLAQRAPYTKGVNDPGPVGLLHHSSTQDTCRNVGGLPVCEHRPQSVHEPSSGRNWN